MGDFQLCGDLGANEDTSYRLIILSRKSRLECQVAIIFSNMLNKKTARGKIDAKRLHLGKAFVVNASVALREIQRDRTVYDLG